MFRIGDLDASSGFELSLGDINFSFSSNIATDEGNAVINAMLDAVGGYEDLLIALTTSGSHHISDQGQYLFYETFEFLSFGFLDVDENGITYEDGHSSAEGTFVIDSLILGNDQIVTAEEYLKIYDDAYALSTIDYESLAPNGLGLALELKVDDVIGFKLEFDDVFGYFDLFNNPNGDVISFNDTLGTIYKQTTSDDVHYFDSNNIIEFTVTGANEYATTIIDYLDPYVDITLGDIV